MNAFLTIKDICLLLKVERSTVIRWIYSAKLLAFKPGSGRLWRIRRSDFQRFIKDGPEFRAKFIK
jgi:excisionase family DNA binding protein